MVSGRSFYITLILFLVLTIISFLLEAVLTIMMVIMGLAMWGLWHTLTSKVSTFAVIQEIRRKKFRLIIPTNYEPSNLGPLSLLVHSFYPAIFSFSVFSLAYKVLGIDVNSLEVLLEFIAYAFVILPLTVFIPVKWIIKISGITVYKPGILQKSFIFVGYLDKFIGIGSVLALVLTVTKSVLGAPNPADALSSVFAFLAIFLLFTIAPSILSTALFFRVSVSKILPKLYAGLNPSEAKIHVEFRCPDCDSPINLDEIYCSKCGRKIKMSNDRQSTFYGLISSIGGCAS